MQQKNNVSRLKKITAWFVAQSPQRIIALSTTALAVFAFVTAIYAYKSFKELSQQVDIQFNTYKKINRPYIYAEKFELYYTVIIDTLTNDSYTYCDIGYSLKNVGTLPGYHVQCRSSPINNDNLIEYANFDSADASSSLYPQQITNFHKRSIPIAEVEKNSFFLVNVYYEDADKISYNYQVIHLIERKNEEGKDVTYFTHIASKAD
ncbi:hypothetical protein ACFL55_01335 [Candidatus Latescibacterota bacterium]